MKNTQPVKDIMSTDLKTVHRQQNMAEVQTIMEAFDIRHLPVVEGEKVIGMVSRTDLMHVRYGAMKDREQDQRALLSTISVEEIMTETLQTIPASASILDAGRLLFEKNFSALPVTDDDDKLVGIVTTKDMLGYFLAQS